MAARLGAALAVAVALAGAVAAALADGDGRRDAPTRRDEGAHIVVLGSSTAAGTGTSHPESSWVARYGALLAVAGHGDSVTNLAAGGYTTYHVMPAGARPPEGRPLSDSLRNITRALRLAPDAVIVNLPSNDIAYGYSIGEVLACYDIIAAAARRAGVPVWFMTSQPRNLEAEGRRSLAAVRDSTLARYGAHAIDFWEGLADGDGAIDARFDVGDGIHLNDAGHRILFERVARAAVAESARAAHGLWPTGRQRR